MKLTALLSRRDSGKASYTGFLTDIVKKFTDNSLWTGKRQITKPVSEDYMPESSDNSFTPVSYTVPQAIQYFLDENLEYLNTMLSIDATNASGIKEELIVDGVSYGELTSLELMQLRSILMDNKFVTFIKRLPTYDLNNVWEPVEDKDGWWQKEPVKFAKTTTEKSYEILRDPNLDKVKGSYTPVKSEVSKKVHLADRTIMEFHGGISPDVQAQMLSRREKFLTGVNEALARVNTHQAVETSLDISKVFTYIFEG